MSTLDDLRATFFQECDELLEQLSSGLCALEAGGPEPDIETVHAVFRAVHSIKGGAGAFGFKELVDFAHVFETALDRLRSGKSGLTPNLMAALLRSSDFLADLVACARDGKTADRGRLTALRGDLETLTAAGLGDDTERAFEFVPVALPIAPLTPSAVADPNSSDTSGRATTAPDAHMGGEASRADRNHFLIRLEPRAGMYRTGNEPVALIRALGKEGVLQVRADLSRIVPLDVFDPNETKLAWDLHLDTEANIDEIRALFEFVEDVCNLEVRPVGGDPEEPPDAGTHGSVSISAAGASGRDGGFTTPSDAAADRSPGAAASSSVRDGSRPADEKGAENGGRTPASSGASSPTGSLGAMPPSIRVNLDRVDRLINLIGELVIMEAMLSQLVREAGLMSNSDVANGLDGIKHLASEIQESVMAIRAQPLKSVFQRMQRVVREAADATGKPVRLVTIGENTEVDKTVIERLVDPLTHMIRNAVDHGIEDAAGRRAAGKPIEGTITLSAAHRSGRVIIEVSDDGGGIDRARVREIAERKGLVPAGVQLSPGEIDNLLFLPGFSSKSEVSALSGRGVGLDVVRREILALGGRVGIDSQPGRGTTFTIALPLTLAVLEGMLVSVAGETFVLPISVVVETLHAASTPVHSLGRAGRVIANRGELVPLVDLADALGLVVEKNVPVRGVLVIVECEGGHRVALEVDAIHDQRQVVIKSLEENYGTVTGVAAATILGDGRIALIVDAEEIVSRYGRANHRFEPSETVPA